MDIHLNVLARHIETDGALTEKRQALRDKVEVIDDRIGQNNAAATERMGAMLTAIETSEILGDDAKIALLSAMDLYRINRYSREAPPWSARELYPAIQNEFNSILSSLRAAKRLTNKADIPVLYFEMLGGSSYHDIRGVRYRPEAHSFFTARTAGDGWRLTTEGYPFGEISFRIAKPSASYVRNFINGYMRTANGQSALELHNPRDIVATAERSKRILRRSAESMQTNAVYIGEPAIRQATRLLLERVATIDCDVPRVFGSKKSFHRVDSAKRR